MSAQVIKKINDLISIMLTGGVQPSELADNIFIDSYIKVSYTKVNGNVVGELVFEEDYNNETTLRYYYDDQRKVVLIEEEVFNVKSVIWDRNYHEAEMINDIINMMYEHYSADQLKKFISTLPNELRDKLEQASLEKRAS